MKRSVLLYLGVGFGGMIGASARYILSILLENGSVSFFPWATLLVNLSGAFILTFIGFSPYMKSKLNPVLLTSINTGMIGAFTTFSTIQLEAIQLLDTNTFMGFFYIGITLLGGLLCSFLGIKAAPFFRKQKEARL